MAAEGTQHLAIFAPIMTEREDTEVETCRCRVLNVMSGEVARDYARTHLQRHRVDGMGRTVHRCPTTEIEWVEERRLGGYGDDVQVLRHAR